MYAVRFHTIKVKRRLDARFGHVIQQTAAAEQETPPPTGEEEEQQPEASHHSQRSYEFRN